MRKNGNSVPGVNRGLEMRLGGVLADVEPCVPGGGEVGAVLGSPQGAVNRGDLGGRRDETTLDAILFDALLSLPSVTASVPVQRLVRDRCTGSTC